MKRTTMKNGMTTLAASLLLLACAGSTTGDGDNDPLPPEEGHAFLTIVGDSNVFLEGGEQTSITVKYHDEADRPLAGEISFQVVGDAKGGNVSTLTGVTNADGLVTIDVFGGNDEAAFQVRASALYATPVNWSVAVAPNPALKPLDATGEFELESQYDLVQGIPGTAGNVINTILDMTDDPTDPATWLIDRALEEIDSNTIKSIVNNFRPLLDGYINDLLLSIAPGFVGTIVDIGDDLGQVARKFGTVSTLKITKTSTPDGEVLVASHELDGFRFTIDGVTSEYSLAELSLGQVKVEGVAVTLEGDTRLTIGDHTMPVSYGRMILFALNNVIIPSIDPFADDMADLLAGMVDCVEVGYAISDYVGFGSPGTYEAACLAGLSAAGNAIESQILNIDDTASSLVIHGEAKPVDAQGGDRKVDKLQNGLWEGMFNAGPIASTLSKPNQKFTGRKMGLQ